MKKLFIAAVLLLFSVVAGAQSERMTINDGWMFHKGEVADGDMTGWTQVNLPHCWNEDAYTLKDYYRGIGWYRKQLKVPQRWAGSRIYLKVDGANKASEVYLDGQKVGSHAGGYTAACYDITDYVSTSRVARLDICVDNLTDDVAPTSADFTFMGGIYRDVWLMSSPLVHFNIADMAADGVSVSSFDVSEESASVCVSGQVVNDDLVTKKVIVTTTIYSPEGAVVGKGQDKLTIPAGRALTFDMDVEDIKNPALWSPDAPNLYEVKTQILDAKTKKVIDEKRTVTGLRWFEMDGEKGFFLNGKPLKLNGICRHQDQAPFGYALSDDAHRRDMRLAKEMGANFIRISHYPQDDAILEECDRLGLLAWEEIPIVNIVPDNDTFADNCEQNLREMIRQHFNHPSVITWGYMNEVMLLAGRIVPAGTPEREALEARTVALSERLAAVVREEDPSRAVCMALQQDDSYIRMGMHEHVDILGWNVYCGWYGVDLNDFERYMESRHQMTPKHLLLVSEYGAGSDDRIHSLRPERFDFSSEYQQTYIEHYLKVIAETPYIAGGAYWNLIDFSSSVREESMPRINNKGILRNDRSPKDVYYLFQAAWRSDIPVLHIATRDWPCRVGYASEAQPFKLYSNLSEAELFINGKSLGVKPVKDWSAAWNAQLLPGRNVVACKGVFDGHPVSDVAYVEYRPTDAVLKANAIDLAVNVGSNTAYHEPSTDIVWLPDQAYSEDRGWGYQGGARKIATGEIHLTSDCPLYQTWQEGIESYRFDVPAGEYELELLFADHSRQEASVVYMLTGDDSQQSTAARMDISVNGRAVEGDYSPAAESGSLRASRRRYIVTAGSTGIEVSFSASEGAKAFLNGIKLRRL